MDFSHLSPVIAREARILKSVNGVCATSSDSSLRCAAFRMTEKGRRSERQGMKALSSE